MPKFQQPLAVLLAAAMFTLLWVPTLAAPAGAAQVSVQTAHLA